MHYLKSALLSLVILAAAIPETGCWNYREIDKLAIVAGVAVDKGKSHRYKVTVEIVEISQGKDAKPKSKIVESEGNSMFDAVRNEITVSGKRLYWSHAKIIIISQELARTGVSKIIDWYARDSETRNDVNIAVSGENTAEEIFKSQGADEEIKSFELADMLENEKSLSKAPHIEIWKFINDLEGEGISAVCPEVALGNANGKIFPEIIGTAVFSHDELVGFLNTDESQSMLFIRNEVKAGVLTPVELGKEGEIPIALEIFKNKTKIKPTLKNGIGQININTYTDVAIDEVEGSNDYIKGDKRKKLEQDAEEMLKSNLEKCIKKVQTEFGVDIFGFGAKLRESSPMVWKQEANTWKDRFKSLQVNISTKIHIRNSATMSKTIKAGD